MTRQSSEPTRVPDLILERYRLGEMAPRESEALERRLQTDEELRQRMQALEESDDEIRRSYPSAVLAARVKQRLEARVVGTPQTVAGGSFGLSWKTAAVVVGVLALVVLMAPPLPGPGDESTDRVKGLEPSLLLFRKTAEGSEPLQDRASVHAGDLIRIGYRAAGRPWGLILSVDGDGAVTRHLPREGARAARLSAESQVLLDFAYELDDAPRWERFYFVTGSAPFDVAPVVDAAKRVAAPGGALPPPVLALPMNVKQASVLLIKEETP